MESFGADHPRPSFFISGRRSVPRRLEECVRRGAGGRLVAFRCFGGEGQRRPQIYDEISPVWSINRPCTSWRELTETDDGSGDRFQEKALRLIIKKRGGGEELTSRAPRHGRLLLLDAFDSVNAVRSVFTTFALEHRSGFFGLRLEVIHARPLNNNNPVRWIIAHLRPRLVETTGKILAA